MAQNYELFTKRLSLFAKCYAPKKGSKSVHKKKPGDVTRMFRPPLICLNSSVAFHSGPSKRIRFQPFVVVPLFSGEPFSQYQSNKFNNDSINKLDNLSQRKLF